MIRKVYIDTSVVGGYFDEEFELWTKLFFKAVENDKFRIAVSEILFAELTNAPNRVKWLLNGIPEKHRIVVEYNEEARLLANKYLEANIVGQTSLTVQTHCNCNSERTWYFDKLVPKLRDKHIVNLDKIHLYNGINLQNNYRTIEIRTPRELLNYENIW